MYLPYCRFSALVGITLILSAAFLMPAPRLGAGRDRDRVVRVPRGGPQRLNSGSSTSHAADDVDVQSAMDDGVQRVGAQSSGPSIGALSADTSPDALALVEARLIILPAINLQLLVCGGDQRGCAQNVEFTPPGRAPPAA